MIYIVHHSADFDGFFSGLITGIGVLKENVNEIKFVPYNYGKDGIFVGKKKNEIKLEDVVKYDDWVYFVDVFYANKEFMNKLIEKIGDPAQVVLIDHHESSIEWVKKECPSIEYSWSANSSEPENMISAAGLCWNRFFGDHDMPEIVRLISDYDIWNKSNQKRWDEEILPFQYGMRNKGINMFDIPIYLDEYRKIIYEDPVDFKTSAIKDGKAVIEYQKSRSKTVLRSTGFEAFLDTKESTYFAYFGADYCANSTLFEWGLNEEEYEKYEVFVLCRPVIGTNKSYISIISNRDDIDASEICALYGGGGHKKIAGCVVNIVKHRIDEDNETRVEFEEAE